MKTNELRLSVLFFIAPLLLFFIFSSLGFSAETCSRTVTINYQNVLIDNNSTQKGEGLRYHLGKDEIAKKYLDEYQAGLRNKKINAFLGTAGSLLIFSGLLVNGPTDRKRTFLVGGASIMLINFLVAKTIEYKNESNLRRAIDEYNKRNLPRINFDLTFNERENNSFGLVNGGLIKVVNSF